MFSGVRLMRFSLIRRMASVQRIVFFCAPHVFLRFGGLRKVSHVYFSDSRGRQSSITCIQ